MAKVRRLSQMTPFLQLRTGEWFLVKVTDQTTLDVHGDERAVLKVAVFHSEVSAIPALDDLLGLLGSTPVEGLLAQGKGLAEALEEIDGNPMGRILILRYGGRKDISGGKTFNVWDVQEIELEDSERETLGL